MSRLLTAAGHLVDRIKINTLTRRERDGRPIWAKQRRRSAPAVISLANAFFRLAGNPVTILSDPTTWHAWELSSMQALHGGQFGVWTDETGTLFLEELPGRSLSDHLVDGTATTEMFAAAGREFQRAHAITCPWFEAGWSHGDPHTGNVIFDPATTTARLLDFEVRHDRHLPAVARHTDDLLVFLQDTLGRLPRDRWLEWASVFVHSYGRPEITTHLVERLAAPRGIARLWWAVRTTYLAPQELAKRLAALREVLVA